MTDRLRINGWMVAETDLEHGYHPYNGPARSISPVRGSGAGAAPGRGWRGRRLRDRGLRP